MHMDKRLRVVCFSASVLVVAYLLTASFVIDHTYKRRWSDLLYAPVYWAIQEEWFGRELAHWYYYRVCRMKLLVPLIDRSR
jgi:hypothetical protein